MIQPQRPTAVTSNAQLAFSTPPRSISSVSPANSSHTVSFSTDSLVSEIFLRTSDASSGLGEDLDGLESEEVDYSETQS
jgi:hypothetical protein